MDIYVGNLSFDASEDDVRGAFATFGTVESVKMIMDRETGRPRGFAFITMTETDEANTAIESLNGSELLGRELRVREATPRPEPVVAEATAAVVAEATAAVVAEAIAAVVAVERDPEGEIDASSATAFKSEKLTIQFSTRSFFEGRVFYSPIHW